MHSTGALPKVKGLTVEQLEAMMQLSCLPAFKDLVAKVQADEVRRLLKQDTRPLARQFESRFPIEVGIFTQVFVGTASWLLFLRCSRVWKKQGQSCMDC